MLEDWAFDNVAAIAGVNPVPLELEVLNIDGSNDPLLGPPGFDITSLDKLVQVHTQQHNRMMDE